MLAARIGWTCGIVAAILCILFFIRQANTWITIDSDISSRMTDDFRYVYVFAYIAWVICFGALLIDKKMSEPLFPKFVAVFMLMIKGILTFKNLLNGIAYNICASMLFLLSSSKSFYDPASKVSSRTFATIGSTLLLGCAIASLKDESGNALSERSYILVVAFIFLGLSCILPAKNAWFPSKIKS